MLRTSLVPRLAAVGILLLSALPCAARDRPEPRPELVFQVGHNDYVSAFAVSRDGRLLASGSRDRTIKIWDAHSGACLRTTPDQGEEMRYLGLSPDARFLVSAATISSNSTKDVRLWDVASGTEILRLTDDDFGALRLGPDGHDFPFSPDSRWLTMPFMNRPVLVDLVERKTVSIPGVWKSAWRAAWSGDGRRLAILGFRAVVVLDVPSLRTVATVPVKATGGSSSVSSIALDATGDRLAYVDKDTDVTLVDVASGRVAWRAALPRNDKREVDRLRAVAFLDDVVAGLTWGHALAWSASDGSAIYDLPLTPREADVALSTDWKAGAFRVRRPDGGADVSIWDPRTGSVTQKFEASSAGFELGISGDGRLLVAEWTGTSSGPLLSGRTFMTWDTATGQATSLNAGQTYPSEIVAWSPDGRRIVTGELLRVWDLETGAPFSPPTRNWCRFVAMWGTHLADAFAMIVDGELVVLGVKREVEDGPSTVRTRAPIPVDIGALTSCEFSPDGATLITSETNGSVRAWDAETGASRRAFGGLVSGVDTLAFDADGRRLVGGDHDGRVRVWDAASGAVVAALDGAPGPVRLVRFAGSGDGDALYALSGDGRLRSWRAGAWTPIRSERVVEKTVTVARGLGAESAIVMGDADGNVYRFDLATWKTTAAIRPGSDAVSELMYFSQASNGPEVLAVAGSAIAQWNLRTGKVLVFPSSHDSWTGALAFVPNGHLLATSTGLLETDTWTLKVPAAPGNPAGPTSPYRQTAVDGVRAVAVDPTGRMLAGDGMDGLRTIDVTTGKKLAQLGELPGENQDESRTTTRAVAFSPDSRSLACAVRTERSDGSDGSNLRVYRLADGSSFALGDASTGVHVLAYTPDGRLVTGDARGGLRLWDVEARAVTATASLPGGAPVNDVVVAPGGRAVAVSSGTSVELLELPSLAPLHTFSGHAKLVGGLAFSPDGRLLLSGCTDGTVRLWDVETSEHLATLVPILDSDGWLVVTPDGLFDGSQDAWSRIRWRFGADGELAPVEAFFSDFYTPGLLAKLVAGERPKAARDIASLDRRQPTVALRSAAPAGGRDVSGDVSVEIDVAEARPDASHPTGSGARDVRLFRDGVLVRAWRGDVLADSRDGRAHLTATIPAVAGDNTLTAYAFNRDDVKSADASLTFAGPASVARPRVAHVVVVGVSDYENPAFDLRFAADDARDFAEETRRRLEGTRDFARVDVVELLDGRATRANVLDALAGLASCGPDDTVFVFFAGHGVVRGDRFYLVPHDMGYDGPRDRLDAAALDRVAARSVSDRDLELVLERVDAAHMLLVVDACFAERVLGESERKTGPLNSRGLAQLAYEKGMYVLAAAEGDQRAVESSSLGHGVLTYALVDEGLKQAEADSEPKDGRLFLGEWLDYAARRVPQIGDRLAREAEQSREILHATPDEAAAWDLGRQTPRLFARPRRPPPAPRRCLRRAAVGVTEPGAQRPAGTRAQRGSDVAHTYVRPSLRSGPSRSLRSRFCF